MHVSRVKSILCKYVQFRVPSTLSSQLLTSFFLLSLSPGSALLAQSSAAASMLRPPMPGTPPPVPRGRFSSLTAAARGLLRWHGWTHTPEQGPLVSEPTTPRALSSEPLPTPVFSTTPGPKENARFSFAGKRHHLAILRALRLRPRRREIWLRKPTWAKVSVYLDLCLGETGFCCKSQRLTSSDTWWVWPTLESPVSSYIGALNSLQGTFTNAD